jgi:glucosamine--fructose-6-phosphate aminotransferase (isomerizing)
VVVVCGIVACAGHGEGTLAVLLDALASLDYRGYDSAGVALAEDRLAVRKCAGDVTALRDAVANAPPEGSVGVGHTRWSTHGPPTDANAHPHTDADDTVAVVHNGIVENYRALRADLEAEGVDFTSETDTEVVPHLVARHLSDGADPETAFRRAVARLEGSYALAAVVAGSGRVFGARSDSPLVLGVGEDATYLASDVPAFLAHTRQVVYLSDGEFAVLDADGWRVTDAAGATVEREPETVAWSAEQTGKGGYEHFMLKEIHEQPTALRQALSGRLDVPGGRVVLDDLGDVGDPAAVHLVGCGTSHHAALYGASLLWRAGRPAQAVLASEYATSPPPVEEDTLVVGVTQSGETADTLAALRNAADRNARTLAVTNVVGSTAARECEDALFIRAGPEVGVAATKTFSAQVVALNLLAEAIVGDATEETRALLEALRTLPGHLQDVLEGTSAPAVVEACADADAFFFVGRGLDYPVAREGALTFTEITYEHAEGFAAGELKHGPLALVDGDTPLFAVVTGDDEHAHKTVDNVAEAATRGAPVVAVTDGATDVEAYADHVLQVPSTHARVAPVLANVQLQLVAYHTADRLGRPIDKPRHLAKSVTVE